MANQTVTVLEADGVTSTDVEVLGFGRQAAAASKSTAMSTEDKSVFDAIAASLALLDNVTQTTAAPTGADTALVVGIHPDSQNANGRVAAASSAPIVLSTEDKTALDAVVTAVQLIDNAISGSEMQVDVVAALPAGEAHIGEVGGKSVTKTITMTADTAIMASADIIADTQQMDAAFRKTDGTGVINSITVFDPDDNTAFAFDLYVHRTSTSMGSENAGITISDANAAAGIIGVVSFATTDAKDLINGRMYHKSNLGLVVSAVSGTDDLYFSLVNGSGTPTFAGGSIPVVVGMLQD